MRTIPKTLSGVVRIIHQALGRHALPIFLFFLPWQTRYIFRWGKLADGPWEYGTIGLYAVELLFVVVCSLRWQEIRQSMRANRNLWLVTAAVLVYLGISILWTSDQWLAFRIWITLIEAWFLFVLVREEKSVKRCLAAFVGGVLVQVIIGFVQVLVQWSPPFAWLGMAEHDPFVAGASVVMVRGERFLRAYGGLPHPNVLGGYIVVALGAVVWLRAYERDSRRRLGLLLAAAFLNLVLFFTFSRSAWIAVLVLFGIVFSLAWHWWQIREHFSAPWRREIWAIAAVFLITFVIGSTLFPEAWHDRVSGNTSLETRSQEERIIGTREALILIREHPIIGVGLGNYTNALATRFPGQTPWSYQPVHNVPLLLFAELGLVGVGLFFVLLWHYYRGLIRKNHSFIVFLAPALLVLALFDHYLWSLSAGVFLLAITCGLSRLSLDLS